MRKYILQHLHSSHFLVHDSHTCSISKLIQTMYLGKCSLKFRHEVEQDASQGRRNVKNVRTSLLMCGHNLVGIGLTIPQNMVRISPYLDFALSWYFSQTCNLQAEFVYILSSQSRQTNSACRLQVWLTYQDQAKP